MYKQNSSNNKCLGWSPESDNNMADAASDISVEEVLFRDFLDRMFNEKLQPFQQQPSEAINAQVWLTTVIDRITIEDKKVIIIIARLDAENNKLYECNGKKNAMVAEL